MPTYVLTFRSAADVERTPETTAAWRDFFAGVGDQLVELGQPVMSAASVGLCDTESTRLGGYSIIRADDLGVFAQALVK